MFDRRLPPRGFSILEFIVAMTLFGFVLAGLFPLLAKYSQQVQRLEKCSPLSGRWKQNTDKTWTFPSTDPNYDTAKMPSAPENRYSYPDQWNLVPADDPWMWKLGAAASLVPDLPPNTHTPYLRPFPYTAPAAATLIADDSITATDHATYGYFAATAGSSWSDGPTSGDLNTSKRHAAATLLDSWAATWTFKYVQPGWYHVYVRWPSKDDPPIPPDPNHTPRTDVAYQILDPGNPTTAVYSVLAGVDQSVPPVGITYESLVWKPISWTTSSTGYAVGSSDATLIYIPKRDVTDNFTTTTDANGHSVRVYKGDTIKVQIQVPVPANSGFITADGMRLVAKPNKIVRSTPLTRTWSSDGTTEVKTVTATVTVTAPE